MSPIIEYENFMSHNLLTILFDDISCNFMCFDSGVQKHGIKSKYMVSVKHNTNLKANSN